MARRAIIEQKPMLQEGDGAKNITVNMVTHETRHGIDQTTDDIMT